MNYNPRIGEWERGGGGGGHWGWTIVLSKMLSISKISFVDLGSGGLEAGGMAGGVEEAREAEWHHF